jgi:hypothetical protein
MKIIFPTLFLLTALAFAQGPTPLATAASVVIPDASTTVAPTVLETPPEWLVTALSYIYEMPVVGPYAAKAFQWLGVICVILTSFTAAILASIRALSTVLTFSGLILAATKVSEFENSKFVYWLKYFSMFNAKKK